MPVKPILVGVHLVLAIIGIDAFLWLLGEYAGKVESVRRRSIAAAVGIAGLAASWVAGGYYYVRYYGPEVKAGIVGGLAPWAHTIVMETKEHVFLFLLPMAVTAMILARSRDAGLRRPAMLLAGSIAGLALFVGLMGFIISAAARWAAA